MVGGNAQRQPRSLQEQIDDAAHRNFLREVDQATGEDDLSLVPLWALDEKEPPQRDWMVENTFMRGTVALVAGDGGIGKSLLMQQLASCAALGRLWIGRTLSPGNALVLACEDDHDELWRRQGAINRHLGVRYGDYIDRSIEPSAGGDRGLPRLRLQLWPRVGQDNTLMCLDRAQWKMARSQWFWQVERRVKRDKIKYLIVDTATQTFRGNQNDETQVMDYITELRRLAVLMQGVVIITKHPSMAGRALGTGESGNVSWSNSVRARWYLHKEKGSGQLVFQAMKSNYSALGDKIALRWKEGVYVLDEPEPSYEDRYNPG